MSSTGPDTQPLFRTDVETMQDPYPMFARLREVDPVHRVGTRAVLAARYRDLVAVLKDPRFGRAGIEETIRQAQGLGEQRPFVLPMMFTDPPEHTRLRGLLTRAFTLRIVEGLIPQIERVTNELIDRVRGESSFDLIAAVAYKVPISTICHLLGMPADDHERIHELSQAHAASLSSLTQEKAIFEHAQKLRLEWADYFRALCERRRTEPSNDIISELVRAHEGSDKLTEYELLATIIGLLFAGHTTTADVLGTGVLALLSNRDQWELLVRDPSRLDGAVEEVLRWDPPIQVFARVALEDADIAGVPVPKGVMAMPLAGAANRDPEVFSDPDRFDITRNPNKHISFGSGIHFCMGSTLARVQIKTVLKALAERVPNLRLGEGKPRFRENFAFRGLDRLVVET